MVRSGAGWAGCVGMVLGSTALLGGTGTAAAQFVEVERSLWGINASVTSAGFLPKWESPEAFKALYLAEEMRLSGSEYQLGVTRGSLVGGDSGWSYVRQVIDAESYVADRGGEVRLTVVESTPTTLDGFLYHRYTPFTTIRERVQVGMLFAGGAGWYRGSVRQSGGEEEGENELVPAAFLSGLGREGESELVPMPLFRVEAAAAFVVGGGVKVQAGGGYGMPNGRLFRVGVVYFFGS